jgi:hypothetical protein
MDIGINHNNTSLVSGALGVISSSNTASQGGDTPREKIDGITKNKNDL